MASTASTVSARWNSFSVSVVLPASIFDMSSTSLMSPSKCWLDVVILEV